jgi:hypothetical protein
VQHAPTKQIELRPPVHLSLDRFAARDLTFCLPVRPLECAARLHRRFILANFASKLLDLTDTACLCVGKSLFKLVTTALSDDLGEPLGEGYGAGEVWVDIL